MFIGPQCYITAMSDIKIGSGTMIGPRVFMNSGSHLYDASDLRAVPYDNRQIDAPITIGENVWIAGNVSIAPGATIGDGCVIGMGCVVAGTIPPYSVVVGSKGSVIKERNADRYQELVEKGQVFFEVFKDKEYEVVPRSFKA